VDAESSSSHVSHKSTCKDTHRRNSGVSVGQFLSLVTIRTTESTVGPTNPITGIGKGKTLLAAAVSGLQKLERGSRI